MLPGILRLGTQAAFLLHYDRLKEVRRTTRPAAQPRGRSLRPGTVSKPALYGRWTQGIP